jgi:hypothetical protein
MWRPSTPWVIGALPLGTRYNQKPSPYQVPVLELPDRLPWNIVQGNTDPAPTCMQPWATFLESSTPHFFAREDCGENWDAAPMQWQNPQELYLHWFRWVLSHHLIFLCWHRIVGAAYQEGSKQTLGERCANLIKLCSLMLLYAASCPNALYKKHIRTFMALYHAGFTAKWSLEYHAYKIAVEKLLGGGLPADADSPLRSAYYEHKMVHMAVAKKFMGVAPSLLKMHSSGHGDLGDLTPETQFVYDAFFLVKRTEQPAHTLATAFEERLVQMQMDLHFNPFFPGNKVPKLFQGQRKIKMLLDSKEQIMEGAAGSF